MTSHIKKNYQIYLKLGIGLLLIDLAILLFIIFDYSYQKYPSFRYFVTMATTRQPETFTELYFENHTQLPAYIERYKAYPYSFTIHNLEYKDMNYRYETFIEMDGKKLPLDSGAVLIKKDGAKTIQQTLKQDELKGRVKVVVNLPDLNQRIDFWIQNK